MHKLKYRLTRHNEAAALRNARQQERAKWQGIVAENQTTIAEKDSENAALREQLAKLQAQRQSE